MARHVRDLALALDVAGGQSPLDPWSVSPAVPARREPLRVAVTTNPGELGCDATIARGVEKAARALAEAGCIVETVEPPSVAEAHELWGTLLSAETRTMIVPFASAMLSADAMTVIEHLIGGFPQLDLMSYMEALGRRTRVARDWAKFFEDHDLVLGPVCCRPPFTVGYDLGERGMADIMQAMRLVTACNLLGLPAAVVPVGIVEGMPQSVQLIASRHRDETCLVAAQMIEDRCGVVTPIDPRD
jgi:amidase